MGFLMECQNIIKNLKINKDKSIGEIVVVVEGESEEFKLMKYIFTKVLDYNYVPLKRGKVMRDEFKSKTNSNSTVIVANTCNSNISSIMKDENYRDELYKLLITDYNRSLKNTRIYILWDRDFESNDEKIVSRALESFKNSMDNEQEMNGILLLSYPCIESYEISNFDKQLYKKTFKNSQETKDMYKAKRYSLSKMSCNTILNAIGNMHRSMKDIGIKNYDTSDFYYFNKKIFDYEEKLYCEDNTIKALSLLSIMLVDLGIIYE
jgi:hypothetical protein